MPIGQKNKPALQVFLEGPAFGGRSERSSIIRKVMPSKSLGNFLAICVPNLKAAIFFGLLYP
jgi:hypothetical protein